MDRRAVRASMQSRRSDFYTNISVPAVGATTYKSWEDEVAQLFETIGKLQEAAMLPSVGDDLDDIGTLVARLPADIEQIRQRGYVHQAHMEAQVGNQMGQWEPLQQQVSDALYERQVELVDAANRLLDMVDRLYEPGAGQDTVNNCWAGVRALQSRIESASKSLTGMYDSFSSEMIKVEEAIDRVEWMLDQLDTAKFDLIQGEAPIRAAGARWIRQAEDEGELGILYLTDQRILFEQKEERTVEKFLFIAVKKETVHEFRFAAPIQAILDVKIAQERAGFLGLGKENTFELSFDHTADLSSVFFHFEKDDPNEWAGLIGRIKSGEIDGERTAAAAVKAEALDEIRSEIPTNCPNCAAPIDQVIVRGMTEITCSYCGTVIRI